MSLVVVLVVAQATRKVGDILLLHRSLAPPPPSWQTHITIAIISITTLINLVTPPPMTRRPNRKPVVSRLDLLPTVLATL
jgi:hypothetical protein